MEMASVAKWEIKEVQLAFYSFKLDIFHIMNNTYLQAEVIVHPML
jgi:hypothetical protein